MSREEASLFFRLVTYRCGRGSLLITMNKIVRDWTEILPATRRSRPPSSIACFTGPRHQHRGEKLPTKRPRERAEQPTELSQIRPEGS